LIILTLWTSHNIIVHFPTLNYLVLMNLNCRGVIHARISLLAIKLSLDVNRTKRTDLVNR